LQTSEVVREVAAWVALVATALTLLSALSNARTRNRARRNLAADADLFRNMPDGAGKDALARAIDFQAQRMSTRIIEGWRISPLRFTALLGTFCVLAGLVSAASLWLDEAGITSSSEGFTNALRIGGRVTFSIGYLLLLGALFWFAFSWLLQRSDERVLRFLTRPLLLSKSAWQRRRQPSTRPDRPIRGRPQGRRD